MCVDEGRELKAGPDGCQPAHARQKGNTLSKVATDIVNRAFTAAEPQWDRTP